MRVSTFWSIKAGAGWLVSLSGLAWGGGIETWQGRLWLLLLSLSIACTTIAVVLRCTGRELEAMRLGMDIQEHIGDAPERSTGTVRPIR